MLFATFIIFYAVLLGLVAMCGLVLLAVTLLAFKRMTKAEAKEFILLSKFPESWFDTTFD